MFGSICLDETNTMVPMLLLNNMGTIVFVSSRRIEPNTGCGKSSVRFTFRLVARDLIA